MENTEERSGSILKYLLIGFVFSSLKLNVQGLSKMEVLNLMFYAFTVNLFSSIPFALAWMFAEELYNHIINKKNKK